MKKTIGEFEFVNVMEDNGFSVDGARALFNYFEELESDCGMSIEFDPVAIRCEYTEYADIEEIEANYLKDFETIEDIQEYTQVIEFDGGIIIADF